MSRPLKTDRPVALKIYLPASIEARLRLLLYSEAEGTVPRGAMSGFIERLVRHALDRIEQPTGEGEQK